MNRVSLIGRITRDPEVRYSQACVAFLSFSIAVDRQQRDANGQRQADFINCTAFGQQADFMGRYIKKGFMIAVCGRLQTRSYQDQQGQTRYTMDVIVDQVENLTPREIGAQPQQQPAGNFQNPNAYKAQPQYQNQYQGYNNPSYGANNQSYQPQDIRPQDDIEIESSSIEVDDSDLPF
jgi:single-strand DNA-binding protein